MLTRCAAVELAPFQIRVNCIQPGYVPTEATEEHLPEALRRTMLTHTPLGRVGRPEEIGDAVVYLSGDAGEWVTGQVLSVCGGMGIPQGEDFEELNRALYGDDVMDACVGPERR